MLGRVVYPGVRVREKSQESGRQSESSGGGAEEAAVKSGESGNITDRVHQI